MKLFGPKTFGKAEKNESVERKVGDTVRTVNEVLGRLIILSLGRKVINPL